MRQIYTYSKFRQFTWLLPAWVICVVLLLLWQAAAYRGLPAIAAEWEFDKLGANHPLITLQILAVLLSSPVLIFEWVRARRQTRSTTTEVERLAFAIANAKRLRKLISTLSILVALSAVAVGVTALRLPSASGPVHRVIVTDSSVPPVLGPVDLDGNVQFNKAAVFNENIVNRHHVGSFAPVVSDNASQSKFRFFAELDDSTSFRRDNANLSIRGVLRQGGLPVELVKLYRYAGFTIEPDYYVLFTSTSAMRRPYLIDMVELLIFSVILAGIALLTSLRVRRLNQAKVRAEA